MRRPVADRRAGRLSSAPELFELGCAEFERRKVIENIPASKRTDHKLLWNYQTLIDFLTRHGFKIVLLEYFDRHGIFHRSNWSEADGRIWRRAGSGWSNFLSNIVNAPYTSLIADAIKICK